MKRNPRRERSSFDQSSVAVPIEEEPRHSIVEALRCFDLAQPILADKAPGSNEEDACNCREQKHGRRQRTWVHCLRLSLVSELRVTAVGGLTAPSITERNPPRRTEGAIHYFLPGAVEVLLGVARSCLPVDGDGGLPGAGVIRVPVGLPVQPVFSGRQGEAVDGLQEEYWPGRFPRFRLSLRYILTARTS